MLMHHKNLYFTQIPGKTNDVIFLKSPRNLHKNIQLMLEFLKGPFFVLHFSYFTLMSFLMMLSVILLSIWYYFFLKMWSENWSVAAINWLLNLNLIYETLYWVRKWLVDFSAGKAQLVSFDQCKNTGAIDVKTDGSVLEEKSFFFICWGRFLF